MPIHLDTIKVKFKGKGHRSKVTVTELVSWSLTSLFSTNMAISEKKGQGWKVIRTQ